MQEQAFEYGFGRSEPGKEQEGCEKIAQNAVGLVFLLIFMSAFTLVGISLSQTVINQTENTISGTDMQDEFETSASVTQQGFNFVSYMPWIVGLAIVIVIFIGRQCTDFSVKSHLSKSY